MQLVAATTNPGKATEIRSILTSEPMFADIEVITLVDAGIGSFHYEETGATFVENAVGKAVAAAAAAGVPALADDSGLCVDALAGEPGVRSARWAGENATDSDRNRRLLDRLQGIPESRRGARFVCVVAVALPNGHYFSTEGTCVGRITSEPKGAGGFGYDPIFYLPNLDKTFAELTLEEKNRVSHRWNALRQAAERLQGFIGGG